MLPSSCLLIERHIISSSLFVSFERRKDKRILIHTYKFSIDIFGKVLVITVSYSRHCSSNFSVKISASLTWKYIYGSKGLAIILAVYLFNLQYSSVSHSLSGLKNDIWISFIKCSSLGSVTY